MNKIIEKNDINNMHFLLNHDYTLSEVLEINGNNYSPYLVISELLKEYSGYKNILKKIKEYYLTEYKVPNRIVVISDTHIGRLNEDEYNKYLKKGINGPYENEKGLYAAYNHALKNNINTVVHLGDLVDGNPNNSKQNHSMNSIDQIIYTSNIYSDFKDIKTLLLLGNHDYNLPVSDYFEKNKNIDVIGLRQSYISMGEKLIKLFHKCKTDIIIPELSHDLELIGHSHKALNINHIDNRVKLPSLSYVNELPLSTKYIELINDENEYIIKGFNENENKYKEEHRILKLKK